eukprot:1146205-Pelagomonas_calceolata.AAC.2
MEGMLEKESVSCAQGCVAGGEEAKTGRQLGGFKASCGCLAGHACMSVPWLAFGPITLLCFLLWQ